MIESPRYSTILYEVREKLDVSLAEYVYLDMVHQLSHQRWCTKTLTNIGKDMGVSRIGVFKLNKRLLDRGYIEKNKAGHVRTTEVYNKVILDAKEPYNKVTESLNKVIPAVKQSYTKNYNRITKNNYSELNSSNRYKTATELGMPDLSRT